MITKIHTFAASCCRIHSMDEQKCEKCLKVLTISKNLRRHIKNAHEKQKLQECGIC